MKEELVGKKLIEFVRDHDTIARAAFALSMPRKTLSDRYHKALNELPDNDREEFDRTPCEQVEVDAKVRKAEGDQRDTGKKYRAVLDQLNEVRNRLADALEIKHGVLKQRHKPIRVDKRPGISQSTAFVIASDWHLEEKVRPETVEYLNEYNLCIAEARAIRFFQNILKLVEMTRSKSDIEDLVLALLGDFISGYIHEELLESNELSPVAACLKAFEWISRGIDFLLEYGDFKKIIIPCCVGNHGRTTIKLRVSTEVQNSYEFMVYSFLQMHYADNPIVQFKIADGYLCYLDVYNYVIRLHHGHAISYFGGVGGITIPLNKAIAKWDIAKRADLDVLGHYHTGQSSGKWIVNGSLIGYNPYAIRIKAEFERPSQSFFLIHPEKGLTVTAPILV